MVLIINPMLRSLCAGSLPVSRAHAGHGSHVFVCWVTSCLMGTCWSLVVGICVMGHLVFQGHMLVTDHRYLCDGSLGVSGVPPL